MKKKRRKSYRIEGRRCILHTAGCCSYAGEKTELDHVRTRGAMGPDEPWNLMPLCFGHHELRHRLGVAMMAKKFKKYREWLEHNGWIFYESRGRWLPSER